jgi:hypothetical protein
MKLRTALLGVLAGSAVAPAMAQERLVDIRQPAAVTKAMQDAGYRATLKRTKDGEPYIDSAANGSNFTVHFYGCKDEKDCGSLQFFAWYKKEPWYSLDLVNRWNADKRFLKVAIDKDGDLSTYLDVAAVGQTTAENFADWIDWWSTMSGELFTFLDKEKAAAKPGGK